MGVTEMFKAVIVDDEPLVLQDIKFVFPFEKYGFQVVSECRSVSDAMKAAAFHHPHLIITDIRIGSENGLDLIELCRETEPGTHFVILSGYNDFSYAKRAISLSVFSYMLKPIDADEAEQLLCTLQGILEKQASEESALYGKERKHAGPLNDAMDYVNNHYSEDISLSSVAEAIHINKNYLSELFSKNLGKTFTQYLMELRMGKAVEFLRKTNLRVGDIGQIVGLDDINYFCRVFKNYFSISPNQYRKQMKMNVASAADEYDI